MRILELQPLPISPFFVSPADGVPRVITIRPQRTIRIERLIVPRALDGIWLIHDVIAMRTSQFAASGAIPADVFAPDAVGVRLRGDTVGVGGIINIVVSNDVDDLVPFSGAILGTVIR